ncbi:hypothetical protein M422DRAFT_36696, partial [Sphaerobolus stellatus SS14]
MDPQYTVPSSPILRHPSASRHIPRHPILVCPQISLSILRATPFLRCTAGSSQIPQDPGISFQVPEAHWDPSETQKELKTVW